MPREYPVVNTLARTNGAREHYRLYKDVLTHWMGLRGPVEPVVGRAPRVVDQVPADGVDGAQGFRDFRYGLRRQVPGFLLSVDGGGRIVFHLFIGRRLKLGRQFCPSARFGVPAFRQVRPVRRRRRYVVGIVRGRVAIVGAVAGKVEGAGRGLSGRPLVSASAVGGEHVGCGQTNADRGLFSLTASRRVTTVRTESIRFGTGIIKTTPRRTNETRRLPQRDRLLRNVHVQQV